MGLGEKFLWVAVAAGIVSILLVLAIKVGEAMVRRRTAALLAAHEGSDDDPEQDDAEQRDPSN